MARSIWKYELPVSDDAGVEMQQGAEILRIDVQHDRPMIWAVVDPEARQTVRKFCTFGTGHPMPDDASNLEFVGTWMIHGGQLVFHTFEKIQ